MFYIAPTTNKIKNKRILAIVIIVFCTAVLSHLSYIYNGFTWLDHGDIGSKRAITSPINWIQLIFNRYGETGYYRPMFTLLHSVNYKYFGHNPVPYHLSGIFLHAAISALSVFFLKKCLNLQKTPLLISGLIIAVHPISWFTVGSITSAQELLMTLFLLTSAIFYIHIRENPQTKLLLWAAFVFSTLGALLSKETSIIYLPGILAFIEISSIKKSHNRRLMWLTALSILLIYGLIRTIAIPEIWKTPSLDLSPSLAIGARLASLSRTILAFLNPTSPHIYDTTKITSVLNSNSYLYLLPFLILLITPRLRLAGGLFIFLLLPSLNIIPLPRFWFPNYLYTPLIAFAGLAATLLQTISASKSKTLKYISNISIWSILAIMSINSYKSGARLENDISLFMPEVNIESEYREGHFYIGTYYWNTNNLKKAAYHLDKSLQNNPGKISFIDKPAAMINRAGIHFEYKEFVKAKKLLNEVAKNATGSNRDLALYNLAVIARHENPQKPSIGNE